MRAACAFNHQIIRRLTSLYSNSPTQIRRITNSLHCSQSITHHIRSTATEDKGVNVSHLDLPFPFYTRHINQSQIIHPSHGNQARTFNNISEYHNVADTTLEDIQDAIEAFIEDNFSNTHNDEDTPEVNYSSGVLTIALPPHGTWVINKQTPNEQLWWSSPISGPRRYEYVEERERWVYTRVIDGGSADDNDGVALIGSVEGEEDTLGEILVNEMKQLYGWDLEVVA